MGAIAAIVVGAFTGLGLWLLPVGVGLGLIVDVKVLRESNKEKGKQEKSTTRLSTLCCWLPGMRKKRIKGVKQDIVRDE